jgi:adenylate kinase family enzyme
MGNHAQRGYEPTAYPDGTICNAGMASGCLINGVASDPTSPGLEIAAIGGIFGRVGVIVYDTGLSLTSNSTTSMIESLKLRTLIIGNSGSGKSTLAERLGALIHAPVFDLDLIHWKDDGIGAKQDEDAARQKVANLATTPRWVIEGVYGWLADVAIPRATALIWLDVPWDVCRQGLLARGQRRDGTAADFAELLKWAEAYWNRQTPTSFKGHQRLFEAFSAAKLRMRNRKEADHLLAKLTAHTNPS